MIREPLRPGDPVYIPAWDDHGPIVGTILGTCTVGGCGDHLHVRWADGTESLPSRYSRIKAGTPPPWESPGEGRPPGRDTLGRMVREAWVRWAGTQPDPKPTWLVIYDDLPEPDREADRQIGEAVRDFLRDGRRPDGPR